MVKTKYNYKTDSPKKQRTLSFYLSLILLVLGTSCTTPVRKEKTNAQLSLIPQPTEIRVFEGHFLLSAETTLIFSTDDQRKMGDLFNQRLEALLGWKCTTGKADDVKNTIILSQVDSLAHEAYILDIDQEQISITAASEAGYFYALQTLLQLVPVETEKSKSSELKLPQLTIHDEPRFQWRGALLDISRHFFGPEAIKKLIDQMAATKMNRLHLHLTDDPGWRIEIKEYPKLHEIGALGDRTNPDGAAQYLTEEEAREIARYANERQIMIIPEVDVPGHSGAIARAYPEFSGGNNTLNIANDEALKMIETAILRVADLFNAPYVHFGADEVRHHNWEARPDMKAKMDELNLKNQLEFEGWFDRKMADFLVQSGLTPIAWDEAAGFEINKKTVLQWWRGEYPDVLQDAIKNGYHVILSPVDYLYLDYPSDLTEAGANWEGLHNGANSLEAIYTWNPIPENFNASMTNQVKGIEAGIWTEFITNEKRLEYIMYPRLAGVAEKAWSTEENIQWKNFQTRLTEHYKRYERDGINYRIPELPLEERKARQPEAFEGPIATEQ